MKANTSNIVITKKDTTEIKDLKENVQYGFQVRAQSANGGWGDFISPIYGSSNHGNSEDAVSVGATAPVANDGVQVRVAVGVIGNLFTFLYNFMKAGECNIVLKKCSCLTLTFSNFCLQLRSY